MLMFQIQHLNYRYEKDIVLQDVTLAYDNEDFLAIIGPNGGGKSTLLKIILGFMGKSYGVVWHGGDRKKIGYVPQNTLANPNFPACVLDVVLMGRVDRKLFGFYSQDDRKKAMEALGRVGVASYHNRRINELSGGQRQRVLIARALVGECSLLLLDEPTASVDSKNAIEIFELLRALHKEGVGIIAVCHDIHLVLAYANKVACLNQTLVLHDVKAQGEHELIGHLWQNHGHVCEHEQGVSC